jgi:hypothetical protein
VSRIRTQSEVSDAVQGAVQAVTETARTAGSAVTETARTAGSAVTETARTAAETVSSAVGTSVETLAARGRRARRQAKAEADRRRRQAKAEAEFRRQQILAEAEFRRRQARKLARKAGRRGAGAIAEVQATARKRGSRVVTGARSGAAGVLAEASERIAPPRRSRKRTFGIVLLLGGVAAVAVKAAQGWFSEPDQPGQ